MILHMLDVDDNDQKYIGPFGLTLEREYGKTPHGNPINGRWVLRCRGEWIDFNQYRNDIAQQYGLRLHHWDD